MKTNAGTNLFLLCSFIIIFGLAFFRLYMRIQTTIIGYELGSLKRQEISYLENKSYLKMELSKISTKESLTILSSRHQNSKNPLVLAIR